MTYGTISKFYDPSVTVQAIQSFVLEHALSSQYWIVETKHDVGFPLSVQSFEIESTMNFTVELISTVYVAPSGYAIPTVEVSADKGPHTVKSSHGVPE